MKRFAALLTVVMLVACGGAPPPQAVPPVPAAPPPPDPRVAEMQVLLNELLDRLEVMNARVRKLESGAVEAATPAPRETPPPRQPVAQSVFTPPPAERRPAASPPVQQTVTAALGEQYRQAIALFGGGRLDDARSAFQQIFDRDPSGDLADNALYWIAETHFAQAKYGEAIEIYRRIMEEYSQHNKAPDAMLKAGLAYARLGDLDMARQVLEQLTDRYPYSIAAANARGEIERLKY